MRCENSYYLYPLFFLLAGSLGASGNPPSFTLGWSVYVGWDPYQYMAKSGLLKKWADKYGVAIKVQRFDYAPSLDAFVAKNIDACAMTNMEALDMPAAAGVDTTSIIVGDYSNGNDAVLVRHNLTLGQIPGKRVLLVEKTVSQYLFERGMTINNLAGELKRVKYVNTSDSDIAGAFLSDTSQNVVVTWKPLVSQILKGKGITKIFDSSKIPGEILDLMVVRTDVLNRPDGSGQRFAKAIAGALVRTDRADGEAGAGRRQGAFVHRRGFRRHPGFVQRTACHHASVLHRALGAVKMTNSDQLKKTMELVRQFCFSHGLLGDKTSSPDDVAIRFPDGSIQGKKDRVRLRFDASYMELAAAGKL